MPSRLIGKELPIRLHADWVEVYYKDHLVERMERVRGEKAANVNYRHVIGSLVRRRVTVQAEVLIRTGGAALATRKRKRLAAFLPALPPIVPLSLQEDFQSQRRLFLQYPKQALLFRIAYINIVFFGLLILACWGITLLLLIGGIVYGFLTGDIEWALIGWMALGITFPSAVYLIACGAVLWGLRKIEMKLTSRHSVPTKS